MYRDGKEERGGGCWGDEIERKDFCWSDGMRGKNCDIEIPFYMQIEV